MRELNDVIDKSEKKRKVASSSDKVKSKDGTLKRRKRDADTVSTTPSVYPIPKQKLADVGPLLDDTLTTILELCAIPIRHPELYQHTGIPLPRGLLLHGPPGCGKTLLAHAIAGELNIPLINVSAPSVVTSYSGESEKKLREVFDEAKRVAPCVILLDEIDVLAGKREEAGKEMERRIVAQLLTCMDSIGQYENTISRSASQIETEKVTENSVSEIIKNNGTVIVIGATNRPDALDPALRRAGRFDREICLGVPDLDTREGILRVLVRGLRVEDKFDYREIAKRTAGYVGADLSALVGTAGMIAVKRIFEEFDERNHQDSTISESDDVVMIGNESLSAPAINVLQRFLKIHGKPSRTEFNAPISCQVTLGTVAKPSRCADG